MNNMLTIVSLCFLISACSDLKNFKPKVGNGYRSENINCYTAKEKWSTCLKMAMKECEKDVYYGKNTHGVINTDDKTVIRKIDLGARTDDLVITCEDLR